MFAYPLISMTRELFLFFHQQVCLTMTYHWLEKELFLLFVHGSWQSSLAKLFIETLPPHLNPPCILQLQPTLLSVTKSINLPQFQPTHIPPYPYPIQPQYYQNSQHSPPHNYSQLAIYQILD